MRCSLLSSRLLVAAAMVLAAAMCCCQGRAAGREFGELLGGHGGGDGVASLRPAGSGMGDDCCADEGSAPEPGERGPCDCRTKPEVKSLPGSGSLAAAWSGSVSVVRLGACALAPGARVGPAREVEPRALGHPLLTLLGLRCALII